MEHISNEEKARRLANYFASETDYKESAAYSAAMEMAEWKDEKHAKEKQQWIKEACEWIEKLMVASGNYDAYDIQENLKDFKKSMKWNHFIMTLKNFEI